MMLPVPLMREPIVPVPLLLPFKVKVFAPRLRAVVPLADMVSPPELPTSKNVDVPRARPTLLPVMVCVLLE